MDTGAIFHTDFFRDYACGTKRFFSTWTGSSIFDRIMLHETGHRPFGLADEYCCDGGYWKPGDRDDPYSLGRLPNVYGGGNPCADDTSDVGKTPADCRRWVEDNPNSSTDGRD